MPVSDADREAAKELELGCFYHLDTIAEAFAAHREQAERDALERAGLEDCIAQALYDDWRDECELHDVEMIDWRRLPDKETWRSRARAVLKAIPELKP